MSETNRNSLKLDIGVVRSGGVGEGETLKESYKSIPEEELLNPHTGDHKKSGSEMVQNGENLNDGADEKMLNSGGDERENLAKKDEVKFISGDQQNGDAKIDIGTVDKTFTGMTKEELMKYANDPFWVKLRWIFFICFWGLWVAMLVGAILIIINAPKCAAPADLAWWKQGPLVKFKSSVFAPSDIEQANKVSAKGVIYELPPEQTYLVKDAAVEDKIKKLVAHYNEKDIKLILDLTPNFATSTSTLFTAAMKDEKLRTPFVWVEKPEIPNNWISLTDTPAWKAISPGNYVLSQFGEGRYDLNMDDPIVKNEFKHVLKHLIDLGVKGFRLTNTKYFIINKDLKDESLSNSNGGIHTSYSFWTHTQTTFQEGLGTLLNEFRTFVKNGTNNEGFLTVTEDIVRPEVYKTQSGTYGVDLPIYGRLPYTLAAGTSLSNKHLYHELRNIFETVRDDTWLQWVYEMDHIDIDTIDPSAYNMFLMLLPGVPVQQANSQLFHNVSEPIIKQLTKIRGQSSYMHGSFDLFNSGELVAYSRIKSGNPGYFVVLNPTGNHLSGNFSSTALPHKMTFDLLSDNFNSTGITLKTKGFSDDIPMSPYSAAILTYVPVK